MRKVVNFITPLKSNLEVEGLYNPSLRFAVTNILDEEFRSAWDGVPIVIKSHDTVEVPQYLMVKIVTEIVDKIMIGEAHTDKLAHIKDHPYYDSPKSLALGVPAMREVWENQIVKELPPINNTEMILERIEMKSILEKDLAAEVGIPSEPIPTKVEEFAQIAEKRKAGRPKKVEAAV